LADGMPGVWRIVIDTGAEANIVPEDAPLADLRDANALITGASSAVRRLTAILCGPRPSVQQYPLMAGGGRAALNQKTFVGM
jgi:hypothetical protein